MNRAAVEAQLAELPLAEFVWFETAELEFSERIRTVCRENCPRYNKTWACPPAVGSVEVCRARCLSYPQGECDEPYDGGNLGYLITQSCIVLVFILVYLIYPADVLECFHGFLSVS